jgi:hypothetical protein
MAARSKRPAWRTLKGWPTSGLRSTESHDWPALHPRHSGNSERCSGPAGRGRSIEEVLVDYPYLERADILAALEFAAAAVQERELPLAQAA